MLFATEQLLAVAAALALALGALALLVVLGAAQER